MANLIHTPEGVRDIFGRECDRKRYLERRIEKLFRSYGYQPIETPTFEFFDVFAREVGTIPSRNLYKFFDREGNTLVLRPDFTPSVARAVAMYFGEESMPLRLCYRGNVFINSSSYQGRLKESTQMGAEFLNDDSAEAEAEILALVVSIMQKSGLTRFQVSVGNTEYFRALTEEARMPAETVSELQQLLSIQNRFGAQELVARLPMRQELKDAFNRMPEQFGGREILARAGSMTINARARAALEHLDRISVLLENYGCSEYVTYDLGMVSEYQYYTGIIFQAFTYGSGDALIKGGRYDRLIRHFGKNAPAVGFTTEVDALLTALERQKVMLPVADIKTMVLYPAYLESLAIRFAAAHRARGLEVATVRFEPGKVLDHYRSYGVRNQFGGIIYFRSAEEVYAINLQNGSVETVDMRPYLEGDVRPDGSGEEHSGSQTEQQEVQTDPQEANAEPQEVQAEVPEAEESQPQLSEEADILPQIPEAEPGAPETADGLPEVPETQPEGTEDADALPQASEAQPGAPAAADGLPEVSETAGAQPEEPGGGVHIASSSGQEGGQL